MPHLPGPMSTALYTYLVLEKMGSCLETKATSIGTPTVTRTMSLQGSKLNNDNDIVFRIILQCPLVDALSYHLLRNWRYALNLDNKRRLLHLFRLEAHYICDIISSIRLLDVWCGDHALAHVLEA